MKTKLYFAQYSICILVSLFLTSCFNLETPTIMINGMEFEVLSESESLISNLSLKRNEDGSFQFKVKTPISQDAFKNAMEGKMWIAYNYRYLTSDGLIVERAADLGGVGSWIIAESEGSMIRYIRNSVMKMYFEVDWNYDETDGIFRFTDKNGNEFGRHRVLYADNDLILTLYKENCNTEEGIIAHIGIFRPATEEHQLEIMTDKQFIDGYEYCDMIGWNYDRFN